MPEFFSTESLHRLMKKSKPSLILASNSPRRFALLKQLHLEFSVVPAEIREEIQRDESPKDYVLRIALAKAEQVSDRYPECTVIGADTIVVIGNKILGKPEDKARAKEMLRELEGKEHDVITGISVMNRSKNIVLGRTVKTRVKMKALSEEEIDAYILTNEPLDKAGGYGIQEMGAVFIEEIKGSYTNVVGLPLHTLYELLNEAGIDIW